MWKSRCKVEVLGLGLYSYIRLERAERTKTEREADLRESCI